MGCDCDDDCEDEKELFVDDDGSFMFGKFGVPVMSRSPAIIRA